LLALDWNTTVDPSQVTAGLCDAPFSAGAPAGCARVVVRAWPSLPLPATEANTWPAAATAPRLSRSVAFDTNAIVLPFMLTAGCELLAFAPCAGLPAAAEISSSFPLTRFLRTIWSEAVPYRFGADVENTTLLPSSEIFGSQPPPGNCAPVLSTLTRCVACAEFNGSTRNTSCALFVSPATRFEDDEQNTALWPSADTLAAPLVPFGAAPPIPVSSWCFGCAGGPPIMMPT
jgi:hypothetical protein